MLPTCKLKYESKPTVGHFSGVAGFRYPVTEKTRVQFRYNTDAGREHPILDPCKMVLSFFAVVPHSPHVSLISERVIFQWVLCEGLLVPCISNWPLEGMGKLVARQCEWVHYPDASNQDFLMLRNHLPS